MKINQKKPTFMYIACLIGVVVLRGQNVGGGPHAFSTLPLTAREVAMGETGVASSWGTNAIYWNPAGIVFPDKRNTWFMFSLETRDSFGKPGMYRQHGLTNSKFDYNGFSAIFKPQAGSLMPGFGVSVLYRNYPGIYATELNSYNEIVATDKFHLTESLITLSAAYRTSQILRFGVNLKISNYYYPGIVKPVNFGGFDFGVLLDYKSLIPTQWQEFYKRVKSFYFGVTFHKDQDIYTSGSRLNLGTSILLGNLYDTIRFLNLKLNFDIESGTYVSPSYASGFELSNNEYYNTVLYARGGVKIREQGPRNSILFIGTGLKYNLSQFLLIADISYSIYKDTALSESMKLVDAPLKINFSFLWNRQEK